MRVQADDRVRNMVWPSLQADFRLVELYKVGLNYADVCRESSSIVDMWLSSELSVYKLTCSVSQYMDGLGLMLWHECASRV